MARYGIDFYGSNVYGEPTFVDFDATPFQVLPYDVGSNQLHWNIPGGQYTRLRLVRNAHGWPVHEDDGVLLLDLNMGPAAVAPLDPPTADFLDTDLQAGRLFYYSIFVLAFDTTNQHNDWIRAADATTISVGKYNYTERMLGLLPEAFYVDATDPSGRNDQLVRFLSVFGFQLDLIRSQYDTLRYLHDPDKVAASLLIPLGDMLGVPYEPEIGVRQHRAMVRNAVFIAKRKGTRPGTNMLVSSFTGWDADISVGRNLMLDYNDSSVEDCLGGWYKTTSATVDRQLTGGTIAAFQSQDFTNKQDGMLRLTSVAGGDIYAACGGRTPVVSAIPVTTGLSYTLSAYLQPVTTPRNCGVSIRWTDANGATLSLVPGSTVLSVASTWTRAIVTSTAPAGAVYAVPRLHVLSTAPGEQHVADALQFEQGSSATAFQEARDIRIVLAAERINELPNPSAEVNIVGWVATGATLTRDTSVAYSGSATLTAPTETIGAPNGASFKLVATGSSAPAVYPGGGLYPDESTFPNSGIPGLSPSADTYPDPSSYPGVTPPADGTAALHSLTGSSGVPVQGGEDYTLSAYYYGTVNSQLALTFYGASGNVLQTTNGQSKDWINGAWTRPEVSATAPEDAYYASATLAAEFTNNGQTAWFDRVLLERSAEVRPYFDAAQFGSRPADYIWEGIAHQSRSHFYFNRTAKQFRLDAVIQDYLFRIRTHTLLVAQPFQRAPSLPSGDF